MHTTPSTHHTGIAGQVAGILPKFAAFRPVYVLLLLLASIAGLQAQQIRHSQVIGTWAKQSTSGIRSHSALGISRFRPDGLFASQLRLVYPDGTIKSEYPVRFGRWEIRGDVVRVEMDPLPGVTERLKFYRMNDFGELELVGLDSGPLRRVALE